jgi:hypothetical protein
MRVGRGGTACTTTTTTTIDCVTFEHTKTALHEIDQSSKTQNENHNNIFDFRHMPRHIDHMRTFLYHSVTFDISMRMLERWRVERRWSQLPQYVILIIRSLVCNQHLIVHRLRQNLLHSPDIITIFWLIYANFRMLITVDELLLT